MLVTLAESFRPALADPAGRSSRIPPAKPRKNPRQGGGCATDSGHHRCSRLPVGGAVTAATPARGQAFGWLCCQRQLNTEPEGQAASLPALKVLAASRKGNTGPSPLLIPSSCTAKNIGDTEVYSLVLNIVKEICR